MFLVYHMNFVEPHSFSCLMTITLANIKTKGISVHWTFWYSIKEELLNCYLIYKFTMSSRPWRDVLLQKRSAAEPAIGKSIVVWNAFRAATVVVDAASNSLPLQFVAHRNDEEKVHISSSYSSCLITKCFGFVFWLNNFGSTFAWSVFSTILCHFEGYLAMPGL